MHVINVRVIVLSVLCFLSVVFPNELKDNEKAEAQEIDGVVEGRDTDAIVEVDDVMVLNKNNFHDVISNNDLILVEFYAPWCGHCKSLEPEYAAAAKELLQDDIRLAKVDATEEKELAAEYDVSGFPTLKLFKKGSEDPIDFDGSRTAAGIIEFMRMHNDPNYKPPPSAVVELTDSTFSEFVESHDLTLVEFYAPWCGHCKRLAPEYEAAAKALEGEIPLIKVDATKETEVAKKYKVTGYPKLLVFRKDRHFEYKGAREQPGIVAYMREQAESPSKEVKSPTHVKNHAKRTEIYVFASFTKENNDLFDEYISSANELRDKFIFVHTFDQNLLEKFKLVANSINVIFPEIYHSKFEEKRHTYLQSGSASQEDITQWILDHSTPLVAQRTVANAVHKYRKRPLLVVYFDVNFSHQYIKDTQYVRNKILPIAKKYKDEITFAICNEEEFKDELKQLGLDDSGEDVYVALFGENDTKYPMEPDDDFDADVLDDFVKKFKKGKLKAFLKSQPIPKRQTGPVRTIVAKTFEAEVLNSDRDVLIEFYAPWCGHCKELEPVYRRLAKFYKENDDEVVIAKMDATANDIPDPLSFEVKGFPTIYFLKAEGGEDGGGGQRPLLFEGQRTFEGFKDFIAEHSSTSAQRDEL